MHNRVQDLVYSVIPKDSYLSYAEGNMQLILSAPHGGNIKPIDIPNRKRGITTRDTYTRRFIESLAERFDNYPYYILADIHRIKVDLNRDVVEGCQGNKKAKSIWYEYCDTTYKFLDDLADNKALYIDIHSHNDGNFVELGYNLSAYNYLKLYRDHYTTKPTTLDSLNNDKYEMIFGNGSFFESFAAYGIDTFMPEGGEVYFNGGKNIETYSGNGVGAIQIELPVSLLKKDFEKMTYATWRAIEIFMEKYL